MVWLTWDGCSVLVFACLGCFWSCFLVFILFSLGSCFIALFVWRVFLFSSPFLVLLICSCVCCCLSSAGSKTPEQEHEMQNACLVQRSKSILGRKGGGQHSWSIRVLSREWGGTRQHLACRDWLSVAMGLKWMTDFSMLCSMGSPYIVDQSGCVPNNASFKRDLRKKTARRMSYNWIRNHYVINSETFFGVFIPGVQATTWFGKICPEFQCHWACAQAPPTWGHTITRTTYIRPKSILAVLLWVSCSVGCMLLW